MSKLKKLLIASLSVALAGACAIPVTSALVKASNTAIWTEVQLGTDFIVDETLNIPERTLSLGGTDYEATITLTYPNGDVRYIDEGDMVLEMAGEYTLQYETKDRIQGKKYKADPIEFFVFDKLWSVKDEKSSIEYGKVGNTDALLVRLAKNDSITFNKIIDLNEYSSTNALIKGFINPDSVGSNDFDKIIINVTDAYDPTQVLTVRGNKSSSSVHTSCGSYWTAAGTNQTLGGWDNNAKEYRVISETDSGICGMYRGVSFCSIQGKYNNSTGLFDQTQVTADQVPFAVSFDMDTKAVGVTDYTNASAEVSDLDKPEYFDTEPLWKGFTTGKVIVSVSADGYSSETANFAISGLFGYDLSAENEFAETDPPELTVDVDEKYVSYNQALDRYALTPLAVIGGNYTVPQATAIDGYSGNVKVTTSVYYDYASSNPKTCKIENNSFKVDKVGSYVILYTAKDNMGNKVERAYWVTAVAELDNPLSMTVAKDGAQKTGVCGERITLAEATTSGGSGDSSVTITATCGDVTVPVSDGVFMAEQAGTWTIVYQAKDFAGKTVDDDYVIEIAWGTKPVFVEKPEFPKYMIAGMEYVVPTVYAYDYTTGTKVEKVASFVLKDANGSKTYQAGDTYVPVANETGKIDVEFVCESATLPMSLAAVSPKEGTDTIRIEKMFIGEGFTTERDSEGLVMVAEQAGNFAWEFANSLAAEECSLTVKGVKGYSGFSAMKVTFTDAANENIAVTMYVENNANGTTQVKFGDMDRELLKYLNGVSTDNKNVLCFSYRLGKFYVDGLGVTVATDDNGKAFNGFPSGKIYLSTEAIGMKAGQKYIINQLDNHIIGRRSRDSAAPRVAVSGVYGGMRALNSDYTVTAAVATDVIDPNVLCFVTVKTPNNEIMTDKNGTKLEKVPADRDYVIKLTAYGQYQVIYTSTDWSEQEGMNNYAISVFDRKAPQVTITGDYAKTAKVGETVVLPTIDIKDDNSDYYEMKVFRTVRNPYGVCTTFGEDFYKAEAGKDTSDPSDDRTYWQHKTYKFTFKFKGDYTFNIVVTDAAGNQKLVQYVVTVS